MKLRRKALILLALVLTFAAIFAVTVVNSSAAESDQTVTINGKNYTIPADKIVSGATAAIFARAKDSTEYTFVKTITKCIDRFSDEVQTPLSSTYQGGEIYMYMLGDYSETRTGGWNNAMLLNGTFTLDLGGHTFTNTTAPRLVGFLSATNAMGYESTVRIKNGTLSTTKVIAEVWAEKNTYTGTKTCNVILDDVVITNTSSSYTMFSAKTSTTGSFSDTMKANFNVTLNNCTLDFTKADPVRVISDVNPEGHVKCDIKLNNPTFNVLRFAAANAKMTDSAAGMSAEDRFSIYLKDYDFTFTEGYASSSTSYFTSDKKFMMFGKRAGSSSYEAVGTFGTYNGMISNVYSNLKDGGAFSGGSLVVYLLLDQEWNGTGDNGGGGWNDACKLNGTYTFDLGGHTFTATNSAPRIFGFLANSNTFDSTIIVKNGSLNVSKIISEVWSEGATYSGTKNCNLILEDLNITRNGTDSYALFGSKGSTGFTGDMKVNYNIEINNCSVNCAGSPTTKLINEAITGGGSVSSNITVRGGTISAKEVLIPISGASNGDSYTFAKGKNGTRTNIVFDYTSDQSSTVYMTDAGEMHLAANSVGNRVSYLLSDIYVDGYGYIPESDANKAFSVFDVERQLHLGSYNSYASGALERVRTLINPYSTSCNGLYKEGAVTMLLRKDYTHDDSWYGNYAHIAGSFTFDLGGNTIVLGANGLFNFICKKTAIGSNTAILNVTETTVKNGTILTRNQPIVKLNNDRGAAGSNFDYDGTKQFDIEFNNVTFDKYWSKSDKIETYSPIILSEVNGDLGATLNATFNDCTFTSCNATMFNAQLSNSAIVNVKINGGVINTSNMDTLEILSTSDENDTLTFGKDNNGAYTALTLPSSAAAPTESYNGGELVFVKVEDGTETATYRLRDKAAQSISYSPKMSLTLDSSLFLNVYIPAKSLRKFTFEDKTYEDLNDAAHLLKTLNGESYYVISTPLDASEALRDLILSVTVDAGENTATGKFTFSVPKYAKKVLSSGTLVEKQVVRDVLSYLRAAYVYFGSDTNGAIATVDAIIGARYDETEPHASEGSITAPTVGLSSVTFALNSTPAIKFYIDGSEPAEAYEFFIDGRKVASEIGTDGTRTYILIDVYAYAMCETVTYTINGVEAGSYHIAAYHAWAQTQSNEKLVSLVERFWKYCQSARDYRNAVTVTVNYVDESGNRLADSEVVCKAPGEKVQFISPAISGYYTRQLYVNNYAEASETVNVVYKPIPANVDENLVKQYLSNIAAWGDSITEGSSGNSGNTNAAKDHGIDLEALGSTANGGTYSQILTKLVSSKIYSGFNVYNLGVGSETTATIAARANTEHYYFYINEAVTLTSEPIVIDLQQNKGLDLDGRLGVLRRTDNFGYIKNVSMTGKDENGNTVTVKGLLTCTADEGQNKVNCDYQYLTYTFTRTDGKTDKVTFDKDTRVVTDASILFDGMTCIIFMGENGGYNRDNATIIAQQEEILEACGNPEFFLIISSTSKTTAERQSLNDALSARWGDNYINMGNVLNASRDSYEFAGYSEEAIVSVLDNIIEGSVTELLLSDACHPNAVGCTVMANAMLERLFELGAFDAIFDYYDSLNA